jgi:hypothetical protein
VMKEREVVESDTVGRPRGYTGAAEVYLSNFEHRHWMLVNFVNPHTFSCCGTSSLYQLIRSLDGPEAAQGVLDKR